MHPALRIACRIALAALAVVATLGFFAAGAVAAGIGAALKVRGRNLHLGPDHFEAWPDGWSPVELHASGAVAWFVVALVLVFITLPLVLAVLEILFIRLRPAPSESESTP